MALDLTEITTSISKFGGKIFRKRVNAATFKADFVLMTRVKIPVPLPKLSIIGGPRPYREQVDSAGNAIKFSDRLLTVYQSKWDFPPIDPEKYRGTYLAQVEEGRLDPNKIPFYQYIVDQISKQYLAKINDEVVLDGVYNASGSTTAAIATGIGTLIDADTDIVPIVTGAITSSNAVDKVELMYDSAPSWMKEEGAESVIFCSHAVLALYRKHYRNLNGFAFDKNEKGEYTLDGTNCRLVARSWMGTSQRLILTAGDNLHCGMDTDSVEFYPTVRLNLLDVRVMLPIGFQYADSEAIFTNDQN